MGIKTRMVPEEYFIMEFDDLFQAYKIFVTLKNRKPEVFIMHPDNAYDLRVEMNLKLAITPGGYVDPSDNSQTMCYIGIKIMESKDCEKDKLETY